MEQRRHGIGRIISIACATIVVVSLLSATATVTGGTQVAHAAAAPAAIPVPTVTPIPAGTGTHGYPYDSAPQSPILPGAPYIPLAADGYVEQEYWMSGGANIYQEAGSWGSNGDWNISVAQANVPYTTRLLVRYPTSAAKFNGTVVFEWLNDTTGSDQDPVWAQVANELVDNGFAYVGVTAQTEGIDQLKTWDPVRYGSLGDTNDGQSYDIFSQAAEAVKADSATLLGGLTPKELIGTGDSQSAFRVVTYVNAIQPVSHAFNGFIEVGRAALAAPIGVGLLAASPLPALIRTNNTAPFIQLNTQGDIQELDAAASRQADNNYLRTWEVTGASHIDDHEATYEVATEGIEMPTVPVPACAGGTPVPSYGGLLNGINAADNMPLYEVEDAAVAAMQKWLVNGVAPPHSPQISTIPLAFGLLDLVNNDQYGISNGGIRLPEAQVPTEYYSVINLSSADLTNLSSTGLLGAVESAIGLLQSGTVSITDTADRATGLCLLSGFYYPLPSSTLTQLYPTHADYVTKYTAAVNADEAAGFLTPADGTAAIAAAQAAPIPS